MKTPTAKTVTPKGLPNSKREQWYIVTFSDGSEKTVLAYPYMTTMEVINMAQAMSDMPEAHILG